MYQTAVNFGLLFLISFKQCQSWIHISIMNQGKYVLLKYHIAVKSTKVIYTYLYALGYQHFPLETIIHELMWVLRPLTRWKVCVKQDRYVKLKLKKCLKNTRCNDFYDFISSIYFSLYKIKTWCNYKGILQLFILLLIILQE